MNRVAGILPSTWEDDHLDEPNAEQPKYSHIVQVFKYFIKFRNLIDLCSVIPIFVINTHNIGEDSYGWKIIQLLRVLRLVRLMSLIKNADVAMHLISETVTQATVLLSVFLFCALVTIIFFGCLIYLVEGGHYTVDSSYPEGAYLRFSDRSNQMEISPFTSIDVGIYWAITTACGAGKK